MAELTRATPADLSRDPVALAPRLLGGVFRVADVAVRLTEVEAYCGLADPAGMPTGGSRRAPASWRANPGIFTSIFLTGCITP